MKKFFCFLLALCLLISGCSAPSPMGVGRNFPQNQASDLDGGGPSYCDEYKIPEHGQVVLYEQTVFFEGDPEDDKIWKPQIYRASLDNEKEPTLFFDGQMIGLFKDVLIACDDEYYYALPLDQKSTPKKLSPAAYTTATLLLNDELLIFGHKNFVGYDGAGRFLNRIDLTALESKLEETDLVMIDILSVNGLLYYLRYVKEQNQILFCVADPADQKETVLKIVEGGLNLYRADNKIFCDTRKNTDFLYDPETNTFEAPDKKQHYFDGGSFTKETGDSMTEYEHLYRIRLQDGKEYTADLSYRGAGDTVAANSFGAAFLSDSNICLLDWETQNIRQYYPAEFK